MSGNRLGKAGSSFGGRSGGSGSQSGVAGRFSLLLLEDGEYYFKGHTAYHWVEERKRCGLQLAAKLRRLVGGHGHWRTPTRHRLPCPLASPACRVVGSLQVCSRSLFFVPRDLQQPIIRIPFQSTTAIKP